MTIANETTKPLVRRVLVIAGCVGAFMVMASVFTPDQTRAGGPIDSLRGVPPKSVEHPHLQQKSSQKKSNPQRQQNPNSTDPHEGLQSLGCIENAGYTVEIYATDNGPRYTVYENATGAECGALLSAEQVHRAFPELQLPSIEFEAEGPLMLAEPQNEWLW